MQCFIRLYNKEAVIKYLLNKASVTSDVASHIRNLKVVMKSGIYMTFVLWSMGALILVINESLNSNVTFEREK
jgi:hypothetical protein